MIDKRHGRYYVVCDNCTDIIDFAFHDFQEAVDGAKRKDWVLKKEGGHFLDICPNCQNEEYGMER